MDKPKPSKRGGRTVRRPLPKRDANSLCACRSGKKWKRCHGRTVEPIEILLRPDPQELAMAARASNGPQ